VVRFYNNLQDRGDCQTMRKSYKTSHVVGWVVGWKESTDPGASFRLFQTQGNRSLTALANIQSSEFASGANLFLC
jgi:hypothetical protein